MVQTFDPINTVLLLVITLVLTWYLRDRFKAADRRVDALTEDVAQLKASVAAIHARQDEMSRDIAGIRSDLVQIALAVGARAQPETA